MAEGRRTQQERRDATIAKLLDGTISALAEVGYARSTVKEICQRAGVSQGALFRYFDTRIALIAASAAEVARRQHAAYAEALDATLRDATPDVDLLDRSLEWMQLGVRDPLNDVWVELRTAARTDPELRAAVTPVARATYADTEVTAASLPDSAHLTPEELHTAVRLVMNAIGGQALLDPTDPDEADDARTRALLLRILRSAHAVDDDASDPGSGPPA